MEETKVVINACFGGFSLSDDAKREYLRRASKSWTEEPSPYLRSRMNFFVDGDFWTDRDLERTDPLLVAIVEEWGRRADGNCASLEVCSLPKGTFYRIYEYDGSETLETRDGIEWSIA